MTKTKKQLRAEAVERLRKLEGKSASYTDYCKAMVDCHDGFLGQVAVTQIIDLLTDDDANDDSTPEKVVSGSEPCVTPESCRQYADQRKQVDDADCESCDSREKLEADMREWWRVGLPGIQEKAENVINYNEAIKWLDRQAAITEREWIDTECAKCGARENERDRDFIELQAQVDELVDERYRYKLQCERYEAKINELNIRAERTCSIESSYLNDFTSNHECWYEFEMQCGYKFTWDEMEPPKFCPNCGCKVVGE